MQIMRCTYRICSIVALKIGLDFILDVINLYMIQNYCAPIFARRRGDAMSGQHTNSPLRRTEVCCLAAVRRVAAMSRFQRTHLVVGA